MSLRGALAAPLGTELNAVAKAGTPDVAGAHGGHGAAECGHAMQMPQSTWQSAQSPCRAASSAEPVESAHSTPSAGAHANDWKMPLVATISTNTNILRAVLKT